MEYIKGVWGFDMNCRIISTIRIIRIIGKDFGVSQFDFADSGIDDEAGDDASGGLGAHVSFYLQKYFQAGAEVLGSRDRVGVVDAVWFHSQLSKLAAEINQDFRIIVDVFEEDGLIVKGDIVLGA